MVALLMQLKERSFIYFCTYLWLATLAVENAGTVSVSFSRPPINEMIQDMASEAMEVAALGRPLYLGMLYDCRTDSFIPGVTLWDKESLSRDLDSHPKAETNSKFSSSDSLSSKSKMLDVSASLKASFLGGLVEVDGSGKYLRDTRSSNQQSRITMHYRETTKYEQLTMTQLGKITYPQVFEKKTATHVVTAVLYGAQAVMVFDRTVSEEKVDQTIEGKFHTMVRNMDGFSIDGQASVNMTDDEKKMVEKIICTFYGDFSLEKNPTTYREAQQIYKKLPTFLKDNPNNAVPIKVWLYPLHLLDNTAARLEREISSSLLSSIEEIAEMLGEAERTSNDLSRNPLVNSFRDIKERLLSFQDSLRINKAMVLEKVKRLLPAIRGGEKEKSLEDILKIQKSSPFNGEMLNQWLDDAKLELDFLSSLTESLEGITIINPAHLWRLRFSSHVDFVVCFTFTSLKDEDPYLSTLDKFLKLDSLKELERNNSFFSVKYPKKWFNDPKVIKKLLENLSQFRRLAKDNKDERGIRFIISAVSNPSIPGSSIYLYEHGNLIDTQYQPMPKPSPPIVKNILHQNVSLKLPKSLSKETVMYRVEYKQVESHSGAEDIWHTFKDTVEEDVTLTGLEPGKHYLIRCRTVDKVGVSEASETVSIHLSDDPVIVGGTRGDEFFFKSASYNMLQSIVITYNQGFHNPWITSSSPVTSLNTIQVIFQDSQMIKVGSVEGDKKREFLFDLTDKIVKATLWPNKAQSRFGGLEFVVVKSSGETKTMSIKVAELGEPVTISVNSGKCIGIKGRSGNEIDALGFYFF